jgi:Ser/Thr protein kinase RdoA (MazF antagonist)
VLSRNPKTREIPPYIHQFSIIESLRAAGFSYVFPPVPTLDGHPAVEIGGHYWFLRRFTPNDGLSSWHDRELIKGSARTLAYLHDLGTACDAPVIGPNNANHAFNWSVAEVMTHFDVLRAGFTGKGLEPDERRQVNAAADELQTRAASVLAMAKDTALIGLTHGDYRPANILARAGQVINVVDWERARHDHHLHDAAFAALQFMVTCPCRKRCAGDGARTYLFLKEYLTARNLHMPDAVIWMLRFVILRRMLLNGRTQERFALLRRLGQYDLTDQRTWL